MFGDCSGIFTDVVCPMLKYGRACWESSLAPLPWMHANAVVVSSPGGGTEGCSSSMANAAQQGFQHWQGNFCCRDLVEVMLRCTVSIVLGTTLSVVCVLVPWLALKQNKGPCGHLEQPAPVFFS